MTDPKQFVSLHNHTTFSVNDGLGYPEDHFQFCIQNGVDAHAITDHGNMNAYAHAQLWVEAYNKKAEKKFKYIPGLEGYFHPNLEEWKKLKEKHEEEKNTKKEEKRKQSSKEKIKTSLSIKTDTNEDIEEIDITNNLVLEDEETSKSNKHFNPLNRRHHLVVLPINSQGLIDLFGLVSKSYLKGFYRYPRFDANDLKEASKNGNLITSSACIASNIGFEIFQLLQEIDFNELNSSLLDDPSLMNKCLIAIGNYYEMLENATGKGKNYLELQFNRLGAQNLVNRAILEFARQNGLTDKLIVTCDAHYYNPDVWRERELYKKLGFMNYKEIDSNSLPKSREELKCELYPKNATQIWEEYKKSKQNTTFYNDDEICQAIERTYDIAHNLIEEVKPDRSPKYPKKLLVPENTSSFNHLVNLCKEGLIKRGLNEKQEYIDRLKEELGVIKQLNNADYFISYQKIAELARKVAILGAARGSGAGSMISYVLYITDLDPLKWQLPFSRFMSIYRHGAPDIDTDISDRDRVLDELRKFFGYENVVPISNYNTFKVRSLVKDVAKFYGIPYEEVNAATATVDEEVRKATMKQGDDKNLFVLTYDDALKYSPNFKAFIDKYPQVGDSINVLFKQNRVISRHAGGVLLCDDLPNKMPLITNGGEPQTPWVEGTQRKELEKIGNFIKYDLLGISTLRLFERTIELILKDNLFEIEVENQKYRFQQGTKLKLSDGTYKVVELLTENDDIEIPIKCE